MKCSKILALIFAFVLVLAGTSHANWLDDWYQNAMTSSSGIDYFKGQKRGYATFGSFSMRLPLRTDYLFSIEKPHLKVGCGGIDLFMGGFSFLNADYLVQKVQAMLQAAPFIAFDIALQTLFPEGSEILKKAESIVDMLNQIQLSECGIYVPKAVVDLAKDPTSFFKSQGEENAKIAQEKGYSDIWHKFWNKYVHVTDSDVSVEGVSTDDVLKGLPLQLQNWLKSGTTQGFVEYLAKNGIIDSQVAEIFRAYIGDIYYSSNNDKTLFNVVYKEGCKEAHVKDIFQKGTIYRIPLGQNTCVYENAQEITQKVEQALIQSYNTIMNKGQLPEECVNLIKVSPEPLYLVIKEAVLIQDESFLYAIAPSVSKSLIYAGLLDLTKKMRSIVREIDSRIKQKTVAVAEGETIRQYTFDKKEKLEKALNEFEVQVRGYYANTIEELQKSVNQSMAVMEFNNVVKKKFRYYKTSPVNLR